MLRGNLHTDYLHRLKRMTHKAAFARKVDALRPMDGQAMISRRLGWKARSGQPSFLYWSNKYGNYPIARLECNGSEPHIYLTAYHTSGQAIQTRALIAANPFLDYLMTGCTITARGVEFGAHYAPWPKTLNKPGVLLRVAGNGTGLPFWTVQAFEFVKAGPLAEKQGEAYDMPEKFGGDGLAGLT